VRSEAAGASIMNQPNAIIFAQPPGEAGLVAARGGSSTHVRSRGSSVTGFGGPGVWRRHTRSWASCGAYYMYYARGWGCRAGAVARGTGELRDLHDDCSFFVLGAVLELGGFQGGLAG
jgi:hypothetical protein